MNKNFIDIHLNSLKFLKKSKVKIEDILQNKLEIIDEISNYILNNQQYVDLKPFNILADILVEFIERYNSNLLSIKELEFYVEKFKVVLMDLEKEISSKCDINVYFYGKDKYGFIDNELTNIKVININSLKQLHILSMSNKRDKKTYNILLLEDENVVLKNKYFDEVLFYNKIAESLESAITIIFDKKYGFHLLQSGLNRCSKEEEINSVIVGNSYSLMSISEEDLNKKAVKLAFYSQDLYYSIELAKKAIQLNENIKECIFGISYYILRHDLSSGRNEYSKSLVRNIYYPLLKDTHNSKEDFVLEPNSICDYNMDMLISSIFDLKKIEHFIFKKLYDLEDKTCRQVLGNMKEWQYLSKEDKENVALNRAIVHNKMFKYDNTKLEHSILLKEFVSYLKNKNIKLTVIVFPTTKQYYDNIMTEFKDELELVLDYLKENEAFVLDLREYSEEFNDSDFLDSDHLNSNGKIKATKIINSIIG